MLICFRGFDLRWHFKTEKSAIHLFFALEVEVSLSRKMAGKCWNYST